MGDSALRVVWRCLPYVIQASLYERKHVLRGILVKEPPFTVYRYINRRGVSEHTALPFIVVMKGAGIRTAATSGQPSMTINFDRRFQMQAPSAFGNFGHGDHASLLHDLQIVQRENRFGGRLHLQRPTTARQFQCVPDA